MKCKKCSSTEYYITDKMMYKNKADKSGIELNHDKTEFILSCSNCDTELNSFKSSDERKTFITENKLNILKFQ